MHIISVCVGDKIEEFKGIVFGLHGRWYDHRISGCRTESRLLWKVHLAHLDAGRWVSAQDFRCVKKNSGGRNCRLCNIDSEFRSSVRCVSVVLVFA